MSNNSTAENDATSTETPTIPAGHFIQVAYQNGTIVKGDLAHSKHNLGHKGSTQTDLPQPTPQEILRFTWTTSRSSRREASWWRRLSRCL